MVRLRNRYIIAKINYEEPQPANNRNLANKTYLLLSTLTQSIRSLHGLVGVAQSKDGLFVNYFNTETNLIFIRMRRSVHQLVASSLALVKSLNSEPISIQTLYTGATIKHCNIFAQRYYRRELESMYSTLKTDKQKQEYSKLVEKMSTNPVTVNFKRPRRD